ncbi:hypothetical protein BEWA_035930 [Theileria equi strain WA]|uniref:Uncharacterized protein n=1 Tax=Theileria equi strain WA TaxID=1537102 RepID=L1LDM9_THEEQ|nr:hypothetical protein BEWA_035930 [Theileria equi strain WA]EKX73557.1 hypothetical protein BEWA_035930 [Theileria equi strain WA]|eukprot:XP_004833009.1 hypothetical protein BEWA_035930 [Theileria equi strain WA]
MALPTVTINISQSPDDEPGPITYYGGTSKRDVKVEKSEFPLNSGFLKYTHVASAGQPFTVDKVQSGNSGNDINQIKPKNGEPVKSYSVWYWKYDQSMNNPLFIEIHNKNGTYGYHETKGNGSWNPHDSGSQDNQRLEGKALEQKLDYLNCKHYKLVTIDLTESHSKTYASSGTYCCSDKHDTGKKRVTIRGDKVRVSLPGAKDIEYYEHFIGGESELAGIKYNEGAASGRGDNDPAPGPGEPKTPHTKPPGESYPKAHSEAAKVFAESAGFIATISGYFLAGSAGTAATFFGGWKLYNRYKGDPWVRQI